MAKDDGLASLFDAAPLGAADRNDLVESLDEARVRGNELDELVQVESARSVAVGCHEGCNELGRGRANIAIGTTAALGIALASPLSTRGVRLTAPLVHSNGFGKLR